MSTNQTLQPFKWIQASVKEMPPGLWHPARSHVKPKLYRNHHAQMESHFLQLFFNKLYIPSGYTLKLFLELNYSKTPSIRNRCNFFLLFHYSSLFSISKCTNFCSIPIICSSYRQLQLRILIYNHPVYYIKCNVGDILN